jgi:hypothetical protein
VDERQGRTRGDEARGIEARGEARAQRRWCEHARWWRGADTAASAALAADGIVKARAKARAVRTEEKGGGYSGAAGREGVMRLVAPLEVARFAVLLPINP